MVISCFGILHRKLTFKTDTLMLLRLLPENVHLTVAFMNKTGDLKVTIKDRNSRLWDARVKQSFDLAAAYKIALLTVHSMFHARKYMTASAALLKMPPEPRSPLSFLIEGKRLPRFEVASSVERVLYMLVNWNNRLFSRDGDTAERNLGNRMCRSFRNV